MKLKCWFNQVYIVHLPHFSGYFYLLLFIFSETLFPNITSNQNEKIYFSIFRIKGFFPNKIFYKLKQLFE